MGRRRGRVERMLGKERRCSAWALSPVVDGALGVAQCQAQPGPLRHTGRTVLGVGVMLSTRRKGELLATRTLGVAGAIFSASGGRREVCRRGEATSSCVCQLRWTRLRGVERWCVERAGSTDVLADNAQERDESRAPSACPACRFRHGCWRLTTTRPAVAQWPITATRRRRTVSRKDISTAAAFSTATQRHRLDAAELLRQCLRQPASAKRTG